MSSKGPLSEEASTTAMRLYPSRGVKKFFSDVVSVFELNLFPVVREWYLLLLLTAGLPLRRLLAGTLVFGVSFSIGMLVGQNAVAQRFMGNLKLLITMPVSKGSYVLGSLAYSSILGATTTAFLVAFGFLAGVQIDLAWGLAPSLALAVLSVSGLTLFVVSFAPSQQAGNSGGALAGLLYDGAGATATATSRVGLPTAVRRRWNRQVVVRADRCRRRAGGAGRLRRRHHGPGPLAFALERVLAPTYVPLWARRKSKSQPLSACVTCRLYSKS